LSSKECRVKDLGPGDDVGIGAVVGGFEGFVLEPEGKLMKC